MHMGAQENTENAPTKRKAKEFAKWIKAGIQIRGRLEGPAGIDYKPGNNDTYYLSRIRFDISITPKPYIGFFLQAQDSRSGGVESPLRAAAAKNSFDLRLAYMELKKADKTYAFALKAGRQEMNYGARRLIASPDWGNVNSTFDGAVLSFTRAHIKIDL
jgi:hypothetical protein